MMSRPLREVFIAMVTDYCTSVAGMIRVPGKNRERAIELLGEHKAGERMGHRHGSERQQQLRAAPRLFAPAAGRSDSKDQVLRALVAARADPSGKIFRTHLPSAFVEQHGRWRRAALAPRQPFEKGRLAAKALRCEPRGPGAERGAAL